MMALSSLGLFLRGGIRYKAGHVICWEIPGLALFLAGPLIMTLYADLHTLRGTLSPYIVHGAGYILSMLDASPAAGI